MNQQGLTYTKYGIVGLFEVAVFLLAVLGKIDATAAIASSTAGVASLVIALGISAQGSARAAGDTPSTTVNNISTGKPGERGFGRLSLLGTVALAGFLVMLVCAPRHRAHVEVAQVTQDDGRVAYVEAPVAAQGCAWWSGNSKQVLTAVGDVGACVVGALLGGAVDAALVVAHCSGSTLADVEALAASLISFYTQPQPSAGPGASLPPALLTSLRTVYADARAKQGK